MRTRTLLLAASLMALAACGDPSGMTNQQIATETEFCLNNKLDPTLEKTWGGEFKIVCVPAELTMMQKLDFMLWVQERNRKAEAQQVTP